MRVSVREPFPFVPQGDAGGVGMVRVTPAFPEREEGSLGLCSPRKWDTSKQKEGKKKNSFSKPVVALTLPSGKGTLHVFTQETLSGPLQLRNPEKREMVSRSVLPCSIERSLGRAPPQRVLEGCPVAELLLSHA